MKIRKGRVARFLSWYPTDSLIRPKLMERIIPSAYEVSNSQKIELICIQGVPNKFYFLLFSLIIRELRQHADLRVELIFVRSISAAIGSGWFSSLIRSPLLTWWWLSQWQRAWGSEIDGVAFRCSALFQSFANHRYRQRATKLWETFRLQTDDFSLVLDGIEIGDLIVDSYLRFKPSQKFDANDSFVEYIICQALSDHSQANRYFSKNRPKFYLSSYSSYIEHGLTVRVALQHGVSVYTFGDLARFGKRLNLKDVYHTIDYSHFREDFERLDRHEARMEEAKAKLEQRLGGRIDAGTSYMKQSAYGGAKVSLPQDFDGAVVVFLHDFYDSYNAYADLIFCDFWQWICFTIETLQSGNIKFFLKPHPNQINLSDFVMTDLRRQYPSARWLPAGLSNTNLVQAGMICGVTAYGTVSHELAYLGVPTIGYGRHPHHSFDFCRTAKTKEAYKAMLQTPSVLPIEKSEMRRQALKFYYMRNLYGSDEEIGLKQAFIELWTTCNILNGGDEEVIDAISNLHLQPGFKKFICDLIIK